MATAIASEFKMDPVMVLKSNEFDWMVRVIAFEIISKQRQAAQNGNTIEGIEE